jgi:DNA-binding CsgD family transcriptional regulator
MRGSLLAFWRQPHPKFLGCRDTLFENMASQDEVDVRKIIRSCYLAADDFTSLRTRLIDRIKRAITVEASFFAASDPDTLLFTAAWAEAPLAAAAPLFLANEFGENVDVNRFSELARAKQPVATLDAATRGQRATSPRFREIMAPMRLGDELRVALRTGHNTWGFLCLHREGKTGFSPRDVSILAKIAPHAGEALRRIVASSMPPLRNAGSEPGIVLADRDVIVGLTGSAASWLSELDGNAVAVGDRVPFSLLAVIRRLETLERGLAAATLPALTVATRSGSLLEVHAARMTGAAGQHSVAITLAPAGAAARSCLLLAARGLTPAQCRVAASVLRGLSTREICAELRIREHTVQDHLKAVFQKIGVSSRRELVAALFH